MILPRRIRVRARCRWRVWSWLDLVPSAVRGRATDASWVGLTGGCHMTNVFCVLGMTAVIWAGACSNAHAERRPMQPICIAVHIHGAACANRLVQSHPVRVPAAEHERTEDRSASHVSAARLSAGNVRTRVKVRLRAQALRRDRLRLNAGSPRRSSPKASEVWWRRRELNPRPKARRRGTLHACPLLISRA
jgi:hypothetical protein